MEKPFEKLYTINFIDLHILTQNHKHTSNDVFPGSTRPVIKIKVMANDCIVKGQVLAHLQEGSIKAASKQNAFRYIKAAQFLVI